MILKFDWKIKIGMALSALLVLYFFIVSAPIKFPVGKIQTITEGTGLHKISLDLKENKIIRSRFSFELFVIMMGGRRGVLAGSYFFEKKLNALEVAWRLVRWQHNLAPVKITFPEGISTRDMAMLFTKELKDFNQEKFLKLALPKEGYLFPDTYYFFLDSKPEDVIGALHGNFEFKTKDLAEAIKKSGHTLDEIVTMASIIERESFDSDELQIVSGILWKRIKIGMPLQVDASFLYINGKASLELTRDDLKIDSAYNTYRNKGLPPGPIGNPGLDAIIAAIFPKESPYLYYLHDKNGKVYFSKTFQEHVSNKKKYL